VAEKGLYHPPVHFHEKMTQWRKLTAEEQKAEHEKEGVRAELLKFFKDNKAKKPKATSGGSTSSGGVGGDTRAAATPERRTKRPRETMMAIEKEGEDEVDVELQDCCGIRSDYT